jgi:DNA-binding response OmpR family regulator
MNILLIEDDARIADFLLRGLRAEGYRLNHCRTGQEGLEAALRLGRDGHETPGESLVILDLMLPGLTGLELCLQLRAARVDVPILMLTAMGRTEDRVAGLRSGADDYLCKPFDFEELLARIEALFRRAGRGQPVQRATILRVADLELDRDRAEVRRAGKALHLTARELALLDLMMSAPGRVFSRERILANVWGAQSDPLTNVVDVYIRRLRRKVDEGHPVPLIETLRGIGYRLSAAHDAGGTA